jgi:hypothetical protein
MVTGSGRPSLLAYQSSRVAEWSILKKAPDLVGEYRGGPDCDDLRCAMPRNGDERETDQHEQLVSAARLYYLQDKSQERMAKLVGRPSAGCERASHRIDAESGV